jgi:Ca2+/Na+ antiporter
VLIAIGISVPELTTNILSCFSQKKAMIGYGFGAIVCSGAFGKGI